MADEGTTPQDGEPTEPEPTQDAPEEDQTDTPEAQDAPESVDELPEWAKKHIKDLRSENAKHRKEKSAAQKAQEEAERQALEEQGKYKELNEKLKAELEQERSKAQAAELAALKRKIGSKHKLPEALIDRLQGETEEELEIDAKALLEAMPQPQVKGTDATNGRNTQQPTPELSDDDIKERAARLGVSAEHLKQAIEQAARSK